MAVDPQTMRDTLRLWATGVSVVTTADGAEQAGMTVSAFNSLCLEPPLVVVSVFKDTLVGEMVPQAGHFAVSFLHAGQADISDRFAGRIPLAEGEDRFDGVPLTRAVTGSPLLAEAIGWVDCRLYAAYDGVTHWLFIGEVVAAYHREGDNAPLIYFDRNYHELQPLPEHN